MVMLPIKLPPGVVRLGTSYSNKARWYDTNLVRWVDDQLVPIGGWLSIATSTATEPFRAIFSWIDNDGAPWTVYGSADKLYVADENASTVKDITPSTLNFNPGSKVGFGSYAFGAGKFGSQRPDSTSIVEDDIWIFDSWGENLVALHTGDGRLFEWDPNTFAAGTLAAVISGAPIGAKWMIVTNERHIMLFGQDNPFHVIWCDREVNTDWVTNDPDNLAGEFNLQSSAKIISAILVPSGVLVTTSQDAHLIPYVGDVFVYGREKIASNCGNMSGKSLIGIPNGAVWVGSSNFWIYEGDVRPLKCDVLDFFYRGGNLTRPAAVFAGLNPEFREIWFFRPSAGNNEPDEYVFWSFRERPYWGIGTLTRHAMSGSNSQTEKPLMCKDQELFEHENGYLDDGATRSVYAESSPVELGNGDRIMHVQKYYQDLIEVDTPYTHMPFTVTFKTQKAPMATEITKGPYTINYGRGYTDTRFRARQMKIRIDQTEDEYWAMGAGRLQVKEGGMRG